MALSRAMKNLQHDSAQARRGGGNPTGGGRSGMVGGAFQRAREQQQAGRNPNTTSGGLPGQQARLKSKVMRARDGAGGGMARPAVEPRGPGGVAGRQALANTKRQAMRQRGGMMQANPGLPNAGRAPGGPGGTFGFAAQGGRGTPALQQTTAGARMQAMRQAAAPRPAAPAGPAALAQPRGQSIASRLGGRQGPPARKGGMARALGSGGSRRRMLR